ncbi:hypothetical protein BTO09_13800 [Gilvibacter sp. SZ-19]|nr:hypothetical protein BTO09_13800 [Gilvibacter sp. SZ-19]
MKKIFKNKSILRPKTLLNYFIIHIVGAVLWNLWLSLITWSNIDPAEVLKTVAIFQVAFLIRAALLIKREHLSSIYVIDNSEIEVIQNRLFRDNIKKYLNLEEVSLSEIERGFFSSFHLQDGNQSVKISSNQYGMTDKKILSLYDKLLTTTHKRQAHKARVKEKKI